MILRVAAAALCALHYIATCNGSPGPWRGRCCALEKPLVPHELKPLYNTKKPPERINEAYWADFKDVLVSNATVPKTDWFPNSIDKLEPGFVVITENTWSNPPTVLQIGDFDNDDPLDGIHFHEWQCDLRCEVKTTASWKLLGKHSNNKKIKEEIKWIQVIHKIDTEDTQRFIDGFNADSFIKVFTESAAARIEFDFGSKRYSKANYSGSENLATKKIVWETFSNTEKGHTTKEHEIACPGEDSLVYQFELKQTGYAIDQDSEDSPGSVTLKTNNFICTPPNGTPPMCPPDSCFDSKKTDDPRDGCQCCQYDSWASNPKYGHKCV